MEEMDHRTFGMVVECGRHAGVTRRLEAGRYRIGSGLESDIVLSDPQIEMEHVEVSVAAGLLGGTLTLKPLNGTVLVGLERFDPGNEARLRLPVKLSLGDTCLEFHPPRRVERRRSYLYGGLVAVTASTALLAFLIGPSVLQQPPDRVSLDLAPKKAATAPGRAAREASTSAFPLEASGPRTGGKPVAGPLAPGPQAPGHPSAVDRREVVALAQRVALVSGGWIEVEDIGVDAYRFVGYLPARADLEGLVEALRRELPLLQLIETQIATLDGAADDLRRRLAIVGLDESLEVTLGEGTVLAAGEIKPDMEAAWRSTHTWFDERFGGQIPLDARVTTQGEVRGPALSIRAVWTGEAPYIVAGNGQQYSEGSVLDSGWRIDSIDADAIELSRDGDTLRLKL